MPNVTDEIKLQTGASTIIKLKGLATAGYIWNYTTDDTKNCISISKEFARPGESIPKSMGTSSDEIFTVTAHKKGLVHIYFSQQRSWEKNTDAVNEKKVTVIIE